MRFVQSINSSLDSLLKDHKEIILYGEDLQDPYGGAFKVTKGLSTKYPKRVLSTPISEATLIGMAGGMAIGGIRPIVEIMFGDFITLGLDQLLNHLVKYEWMYNEKVNVPVTIRTTMGARRGYGPTHSQSLEPILASIPGLKIISPTHFHNPGEILRHTTLNESGTKIFIEYKMNYPKDLISESNCKDGLSLKYSTGHYPVVSISNSEFEDPEVLIISHGGNAILIEELLIDLLLEYELPVQANFPSLIKPLIFDEFFFGYENCELIIIIEESPKNFGWGNEIVAHITESGLAEGRKVIRIGADELPIPSSKFLEKKILPGNSHIIEIICSTGLI